MYAPYLVQQKIFKSKKKHTGVALVEIFGFTARAQHAERPQGGADTDQRRRWSHQQIADRQRVACALREWTGLASCRLLNPAAPAPHAEPPAGAGPGTSLSHAISPCSPKMSWAAIKAALLCYTMSLALCTSRLSGHNDFPAQITKSSAELCQALDWASKQHMLGHILLQIVCCCQREALKHAPS